MAKEWILNSAMNRFQLNFKRNVGNQEITTMTAAASQSTAYMLRLRRKWSGFADTRT